MEEKINSTRRGLAEVDGWVAGGSFPCGFGVGSCEDRTLGVNPGNLGWVVGWICV